MIKVLMNKLSKFLSSAGFLVSLFFIITLLSFSLFFTLTNIAYAQLNGCAEIDVGNPPANQQAPAQCQASPGGTNGLHWPFKTKSPTQYRRIDQGWDLQASSPQTVYAVASGTIYKANNDPAGFGDWYPYEHLDHPISLNLAFKAQYTDIYYGHIHYAPGILGKHVSEHEAIGYTYNCSTCNWPANWLEVGFGNSLPSAGYVSTYPTQAGLDMEYYLVGTRKNYQ